MARRIAGRKNDCVCRLHARRVRPVHDSIRDRFGAGARGLGLGTPPAAAEPSPRTPSPQSPAPSPLAPVSEYRPWPTLKPTSWFPIIESDSDQFRAGRERVRSGRAGSDHTDNAAATWLVSGPSDVSRPPAARPDWQLSYAYTRWRPAIWVAASETSLVLCRPADRRRASPRAGSTGAPHRGRRHVPVHGRGTHRVPPSLFHRAVNELTLPARVANPESHGRPRGLVGYDRATFGYSISPERGFAVRRHHRIRAAGLGAFADATTFTADSRVYLPVGRPASRRGAPLAAAIINRDPPDMRRTFLLGGDSPDIALADFRSDVISLLSGFPREPLCRDPCRARERRLPPSARVAAAGPPARGRCSYDSFTHRLRRRGSRVDPNVPHG